MDSKNIIVTAQPLLSPSLNSEPINCGHCLLDIIDKNDEIDHYEDGKIIYDKDNNRIHVMLNTSLTKTIP
jgi:hypothetical protein